MVINYDAERLQNTLKHFYNITGINLRFIFNDFTSHPPLGCHNSYCSALKNTPGGNRRCRHSDMKLIKKSIISKKPEIHVCHAGLTDAVVPIVYNDTILGYILLGQIKTKDNFFPDHIPGIDSSKIKKYYDELPFHDKSKVESVIEIVSVLVKHILLENIFKPTVAQNIEIATAYIDANISSYLTINSIAKNTGISKSTLYNDFHKHFKCTVNEYINSKRIEKSLEFLNSTDMSIEEISRNVGFSSASYYSRLFKAQKGISPSKYKQT